MSPRLIAHRGFAAERPENSVPAVRAARVADAVEVDVRRSADGVPVVVHDATVDRVTGATGPVDGYTAAELSALDVLGSGAGIPRLDAVVDALPPGVGLVLELKERGLAADALSAVAAAGVEDCLVSAFDPGALRETRSADPDAALALLFADDPGSALATARDLGCAAIHPPVDCCDAGFVERAHDSDLAVNAWTVEERSTATDLVAAGVDGLIADRSDVLE